MKEFDTPLDMHEWLDREVAVSDWIEVTQQHIDLFAQATGDSQWIHVDVARATRESPYKAPIAHGFLTLSLLSQMLGQTIRFRQAKMGVNYGLNRVRFTSAVPAGARLRAHFMLRALEKFDGGVQMNWDVSVELEGAAKPCLVAQWLTRRYL